ncbi:MAG: hypothetical protein JXB10_07170 [Pirellulales bacterium]|nr:hypothetical protein [Pirellulales bacterium]
MIPKRFVLGTAWICAVVFLSLNVVPEVFAADAATAAEMQTYAAPDGAAYFALSLKPPGPAPAAEPCDLVVLFNTSAQQIGEFRTKPLEALKTLLAGLGPHDRVKLIAVDVNAIPLTETFLAPNSTEMAGALAALDARTPLGTTDLHTALRAAADGFESGSKNARSVVYFGDGRSAAHPLSADEFKKIVKSLVDGRVSVSSYVVGLNPDAQIFGSLAGKTGGRLFEDSAKQTGQDFGRTLVSAVDAPVLWPTAVTWPNQQVEILPQRLPPLRWDRDSVVVGIDKQNAPFTIQYTADTAGIPQKLTFNATPGRASDVHNYLPRMIEVMRQDGGLTMPLIGSMSLQQARTVVNTNQDALRKLARQALAMGNYESAQRLADEVLRRDPTDLEAQTLKDAAAKRVAAPTDLPPAGGARDLTLINPAAPPPGADAGKMSENYQVEHAVIAQKVQADVQAALNQTRKQMSTEPQAVLQDLRLMMEAVRKVPELEPAIRDQLSDQLERALREAQYRKDGVERRRQQAAESLAASLEETRIASDLLQDQEKVKQIMKQFNTLMDEGRYQEASDPVAVEARKILPDEPALADAEFFSRTKGYYVNNMTLRISRQKAVVDTLYQVEKSFVPFPDEPPIVYPDAEVWQRLSVKRMDRYKAIDLSGQLPEEAKIEKELNKPTEVEFVETPLSEVVNYLKDYHKINIELDQRALNELAIATDTPVNKSLKGLTLRSALRIILKELGLTYTIENEVLLITSQQEVESPDRMKHKVYPVGDLVLDAAQLRDMAMSGVSMGGGMGMFNLPNNLLPQGLQNRLQNIPPGGFQAFSVKDELPKEKSPEANKLGSESNTKPAASGSQRSPQSEIEDISLEINPQLKPEVAWERYFSDHQPEPAAVRCAVRRLMNDRKYDQVIALIAAALRHGQVQSWMYQAMALAMQADHRPKEEIERAILSAVDFCDNTTDLTYIAAHLTRLGLYNRALDLYRQAAVLEPLRPEPYMLGLKAARAAGNEEGLRWACLGILRQAWPKEQAHVWQAGMGVARELLEKYQAENRPQELESFRSQLDEAVCRDCIVVVSYTGEGQVDLVVEEPTGTVCSYRTPRTVSGGMLVGDALSQANSEDTGAHREIYVCPQGFEGTYRLLIRRVWGNVTAGKVHVDLYVHHLAKQNAHMGRNVELKNDEAAVVFDLKDGRRREPLREQQVAAAAVGQIAVNRQILAQQIALAADPRAAGAMAQSRSLAGSNGGEAATPGFLPFGFRGAVGYMPMVQNYPEGTQAGFAAVVSADRRYVRVSVYPMFSGISEVNTFNYSTGQSGSSNGSTGGSGFSGMGGMGGMGGGMGGMGGMGGGIF